jgi:hypothetical protein
MKLVFEAISLFIFSIFTIHFFNKYLILYKTLVQTFMANMTILLLEEKKFGIFFIFILFKLTCLALLFYYKSLKYRQIVAMTIL